MFTYPVAILFESEAVELAKWPSGYDSKILWKNLDQVHLITDSKIMQHEIILVSVISKHKDSF